MGIPAVCAARTTRATLSEPPMLPGLIRTAATDRKSTRLNSSHSQISYAVFCLKKKKGIDHGHIKVIGLKPHVYFSAPVVWTIVPDVLHHVGLRVVVMLVEPDILRVAVENVDQ